MRLLPGLYRIHDIRFRRAVLRIDVQNDFFFFLRQRQIRAGKQCGQLRFRFRKEQLRTVAEHQHVLFTAGDVQFSFSIQQAQVAGMQPAVLQDFRCRSAVFIIPFHDTGRGIKQDLSVFRDADLIVRADGHDVGVVFERQRDAGTGLCQTVAERNAYAFGCCQREQKRRAIPCPHQDELQRGIQQIALHEEPQQQRHGGKRRRFEKREIVRVVTRAPAQRHAGAAGQAPQQSAHKAEHMGQRQHAHQRIGRRQRKQRASVVGAAAETLLRQYDRLRAVRCAGREE